MEDFRKSMESFKEPVIVIAGGKDMEITFEKYQEVVKQKVRLLVLVGECKEAMNRDLGDFTQTMIVGSFDESILLAYQKSRNGDSIVLCPGNPSTDVFRDYVEKGNYYKKLIYQL
jgi:UDP-N-acetylmuramoylalanine--D-glutamate ligase